MNEYLLKALREGRISKGLKQSDVAKLVGVKPNTLSNYENGVSEPDIDTFASLCEIYNLDFSYVLGEAYGLNVVGTDFDIKPSEIEHIKKYRTLDRHGKEMVDFTLLKEWERVKEDEEAAELSLHIVKEEPDYLLPNAAHTDESVIPTPEMIQKEEDIMDDKNF